MNQEETAQFILDVFQVYEEKLCSHKWDETYVEKLFIEVEIMNEDYDQHSHESFEIAGRTARHNFLMRTLYPKEQLDSEVKVVNINGISRAKLAAWVFKNTKSF